VSDAEKNSLVTANTGALQLTGPSANKVLAGMVGDALAQAKSHPSALSAARFRIGGYEFCELDYKQVLSWAEALEFEPEDVVQHLSNSASNDPDEIDFEFKVTDGRILALTWDFSLLPISHFECGNLFSIQKLKFIGSTTIPPTVSLISPRLTHLHCSSIGLEALDVSRTPNLLYLDCNDNQLTELDLSNVPALTRLWCSRNQLTELDLPNALALVTLFCSSNQLTRLHLPNEPALTGLFCHHNLLTELNLSNVPALTVLWCSRNQLTELDLSSAPVLTGLRCDNRLTINATVRHNLTIDRS
jgi:Leucine-rich repeat (LRR) protein